MGATKIAIRIDDVCPQMDLQRFWRIIRLAERIAKTGLLGIVPDCHDPYLYQQDENPDFWDMVRRLKGKGWVIAMHGVTHVYDSKATSMVASSKVSEFAGHPYSVQLEKLKCGQEMMKSKGLDTDIFFAPAHSYDKNTLRALRDLNFRYISDGRTRSCYLRYGLEFIPCRVYGRPKHPKGIVTLALHPCVLTDEQFALWEEYITENIEHITDFSVLLQEPAKRSVIKLIEERCYVFFIRHVQPWLFPILLRQRERSTRFLKRMGSIYKRR